MTGRCVCGHEREAHRHWRRGSDCGACGVEVCPAYLRAGRVAAAARWLGHMRVALGYVVRPYDELADRRRWRWQRAQRCGLPPLGPEALAELHRAVELWDREH